MIHLKKFEQFKSNIKAYGESYPISDVQIGQRVIYSGTPYYVVDLDENTIGLSKTMGGSNDLTLNQNQFNKSCSI